MNMRIVVGLLLLLAGLSARAQSYYLLVGTYTNMGSNSALPPQDSTGSKGIYVYKFDVATGRASFLSHTAGVVNPSFLAIAPDKQHVYAATETRTTNAGSLSAFSLDRSAGALQFINKVPSGGDNPVYVSIHRSGRWVAIANYTGGSLSVFPVGAGGAVLPYAQYIQHTGHSVEPTRQDRPHVHSVVFSPDSRSLYAQDLGTDSISIYSFDSALGRPLRGGRAGAGLSAQGANRGMAGAGRPVADTLMAPVRVGTPPGSGPRHLTFHPNGRYAYLIEEMGGYVDVFQYYPGTGHLQLLQRIAAHADTAKGPFRSADIHVSPDGRYLYATNRAECTIAIFAVDAAKGTLRMVGYQPTMGREPRNFMLDPTGQYLLVANQDTNTIVVFRVDKETGLLRPTGERLDVPSPSCLQMVE